MKKLKICLMPFALCLTLVACGHAEKPIKTVNLKCGENSVKVEIFDSPARIRATGENGKSVTLPQVEAASGVRYETNIPEINQTVTLWNKGTNWTLLFGNNGIVCVEAQ